jgi:FkbM family methyltransferase
MVKIFLDVGAHDGASLHAVRDPKYGFDRIYCFEPASLCWPALEAVRDDRVTICRFGLWNRTCEHVLYNPGSGGASLFEDKFRERPTEETARFFRAADWLTQNLTVHDEIFMKLNCEGAECDIVGDLLDSREFGRLRSVMIDPDVRKIPSQAHREQELSGRLVALGMTNYFMEAEVMVGATHRDRIQNWLRVAGAEEQSRGARMRQLVYILAEAAHGRRAPLRAALPRRPR